MVAGKGAEGPALAKPEASCPSLELGTLEPATLEIRLRGNWTVANRRADARAALAALSGSASPRQLRFDCQGLAQWDSVLLTFLQRLLTHCAKRGIEVERCGLPEAVQGMLELAEAVPERQNLGRRRAPGGFPALVGHQTLRLLEDLRRFVEFTGETTLAFGRFLLGRAQFRATDLWGLVQACGPEALPIVSLISFLVGMILAFIGAVQLRMFGAQIYIADLVGLGMAREMAAMMTAILLAGRTGAAFAAELGSMQVNDELDAFKSSGFPPMEFLVLPRILALFAVTPFLCLYADVLGIVGGAVVASGLFDISFYEYFAQVQNRLTLTDFGVGIAKGAVFGVLVAAAGCLRGLQCGRSSTAVGLVTTQAVVTGIVFIIIADAVMNLIVTALNIYQK